MEPGTTVRPRRMPAYERLRSLHTSWLRSRTTCSVGSGLRRPTCCSPGPRRPSSTEQRSTVRGTGLVERSAWRSSTSTTCATRETHCGGDGASTKELMARMGHASARAALVYQHASEERDVVIAERLSAMAEEALRSSEGNASDGKPHLRSAESDGKG